MKLQKFTKSFLLTTATCATSLMFIRGLDVLPARADIIEISCEKTSNTISLNPLGGNPQTAVCSSSTDIAPSDYAFFKNQNSRITFQEGNHEEVSCSLEYRDPFILQATYKLADGTEKPINIEVYRSVVLNGSASASGIAQTARIACKAQVVRERIR